MKEQDLKSRGAEHRVEGSSNRVKREWLSNGLGEEAGDFDGDGEMNQEDFNEPRNYSEQDAPSQYGGDSKIPVGNSGTNSKRDRNLE